jgi:hypothetical protein
VACPDTTAPRSIAISHDAPPPAPAEFGNPARMLLFAVPLSALLWYGIFTLVVRLRALL